MLKVELLLTNILEFLPKNYCYSFKRGNCMYLDDKLKKGSTFAAKIKLRVFGVEPYVYNTF